MTRLPHPALRAVLLPQGEGQPAEFSLSPRERVARSVG